jgi:hypothetical protein
VIVFRAEDFLSVMRLCSGHRLPRVNSRHLRSENLVYDIRGIPHDCHIGRRVKGNSGERSTRFTKPALAAISRGEFGEQ